MKMKVEAMKQMISSRNKTRKEKRSRSKINLRKE